MVETITATGMVISAMPISEYDKRLVILTKEFGKITAFARGARKPTSPYLAGSQPMAFGQFTLYRGRNSYTITGMKISDYFSNNMNDIDSMYIGMYFLELADYYGREGIEAGDTLKLLYLAMRELSKDTIPAKLIKIIFEMRMLVINGEYPNLFACGNCGNRENLKYFNLKKDTVECAKCGNKDDIGLDTSTLYTLQYIATSKIEKLFTFNVSELVMEQLSKIVGDYLAKRIDKHFNSLDFLTQM